MSLECILRISRGNGQLSAKSRRIRLRSLRGGFRIDDDDPVDEAILTCEGDWRRAVVMAIVLR